jgi:hypothetical protein
MQSSGRRRRRRRRAFQGQKWFSRMMAPEGSTSKRCSSASLTKVRAGSQAVPMY